MPVRYLENNLTETYKMFPFKDTISKTTFIKYLKINKVYKKPFRLTDLCDFCEWYNTASLEVKAAVNQFDDFKPGDIVTRIEPTVIINQSMFMGGLNYDGAYVGEKLIFVGIANGCAYFEGVETFTYLLEKGNLIPLPIHKYETGWAHYIDPITLVNAFSWETALPIKAEIVPLQT